MTVICLGTAHVCAVLFATIPADSLSSWFIDARQDVPSVTEIAEQDAPEKAADFLCQGDQLSCLDATQVARRFPEQPTQIILSDLVRVTSRGNWIRFPTARVSIRVHAQGSPAPEERTCDASPLRTKMAAWELDDTLARIVTDCLTAHAS